MSCDQRALLPLARSRWARATAALMMADLAKECRVSNATLADFEAGKRTGYGRTLADIQKAFEDAGIQFIPENGGGAGLRFRSRKEEA